MAHGAETHMELWSVSVNRAVNDLQVNMHPVVEKLKKHKGYTEFHLFRIRYNGSLSNGATEIGAPNGVFDGTSTSAVVYVDSSSANDDDDAAKHARTVKLICLHEDGYPYIHTFALDGMTGVSSVTKFTRIMHAYCASWGSGGTDAAGDIYIQDDAAGTNKFLKCAATYNRTEGSAIFLPANYACMITKVKLHPTNSSGTNGNMVLKAAFTGFDGGADPDYDYEVFASSSLNTVSDFGPTWNIWTVDSSGDGKITFTETYLDQTADAHIEIEVLAWDTSATRYP